MKLAAYALVRVTLLRVCLDIMTWDYQLPLPYLVTSLLARAYDQSVPIRMFTSMHHCHNWKNYQLPGKHKAPGNAPRKCSKGAWLVSYWGPGPLDTNIRVGSAYVWIFWQHKLPLSCLCGKYFPFFPPWQSKEEIIEKGDNFPLNQIKSSMLKNDWKLCTWEQT